MDSYKDISPRVGLAVDLFGNGRTAVKASLGRFLDGAGTSGIYASTNPTLRMPQTTPAFGTAGVTRAWIDANANYIADCNLLDPSAQDLRATGGDLCGVISDTRFGRDERDHQLRPGGRQWVGCASLRLAAESMGRAGMGWSGLPVACLHPTLVPWVPGRRQPGAPAV